MGVLIWVPFAIFGAIFLSVLIGNWWFVLRYLATRSPGPSMIPVVGGLAGSLAVLVSPLPYLGQSWWIPLVADPGAAPLVLLTLWHAISSRRSA